MWNSFTIIKIIVGELLLANIQDLLKKDLRFKSQSSMEKLEFKKFKNKNAGLISFVKIGTILKH